MISRESVNCRPGEAASDIRSRTRRLAGSAILIFEIWPGLRRPPRFLHAFCSDLFAPKFGPWPSSRHHCGTDNDGYGLHILIWDVTGLSLRLDSHRKQAGHESIPTVINSSFSCGEAAAVTETHCR